jgi:tRNA threonylcarbamoyladenosine biosynthesis protein TsaE
MRRLTVESDCEARSLELGRALGEKLEPGDVLALRGELGAGKTLLTRGIARGLGIPPEVPITSPTFTLINEYDGRLHLYHLDMYRLGDQEELETLPWKEALYGGGVAVIEWPERMEEYLPRERWEIHIIPTGDESRSFTIHAHGERNENRLDAWAHDLRASITEACKTSEIP